MVSKRVWLVTVTGGVVLVAAVIAAAPLMLRAQQAGSPHHPAPVAKDGGTVVTLCDGKTSIEVKGLKPGEAMSHEQALAVARQLMAEWQRKHPGQHWEMAQAQTPAEQGAAAATAPPPGGGSQAEKTGAPEGKTTAQQQGGIYSSFTARDETIWRVETQKFVEEGDRIFHSSKALGSTIGVSCDMCHPNARNTHPETYPKYQVQLHRVALLRDMINWCIENPVKGKLLSPDSEKMRALEAYILAQRKGVPLDYGKH